MTISAHQTTSQATWVSALRARNSGRCSAQAAVAMGQRVRKMQPEGGFIGMVGNGSVLMKQDASCIDEIACRSSIQ